VANLTVWTILAIFCIFKLANTRKYQDQRKLVTLIAVGKKYAEKLDGYSDTIDILTNPEEMELIRRAEFAGRAFESFA